MDRNTLLIWTNRVLLVRFSLNSEVEQEWYILRVGKGVLFREVFSVQVCFFTVVKYFHRTSVVW